MSAASGQGLLAVMRELRALHVRTNGAVMTRADGSLARIDAAIEDMAELIEAANAALQAPPGAAQVNANFRLITALARVGGAA